MTPATELELKTQRYIELKAQEKIVKDEIDEINKFFKLNGTEGAVCGDVKLELSVRKTAELTKDEETIKMLSSKYPDYLELGKKFLDYVKNEPDLHQYIDYKESVSLNIKKTKNDGNTSGATSSLRDEFF